MTDPPPTLAGAADELTRRLLVVAPPSIGENIVAYVGGAAEAGRTGARYRIRREGGKLETALFEALGPANGPPRALDADVYGAITALITMIEMSATDGEWELEFGLDSSGHLALTRAFRIEPEPLPDDDEFVDLDRELMWRQIHGQAMEQLKDGTIYVAAVGGEQVILYFLLDGLFVKALEVIAGRFAFPLIRKAIANGRGTEFLRAFRRAPAADQEALAALQAEIKSGRMTFSRDLQIRCRTALEFVEEYLRVNPPGAFPKVVTKNVADEALKRFATRSIRFGERRVLITPKDMHHFLTRHHPEFWTGEAKKFQTFFERRMTIDEVVAAAESVLRQNADQVIATGGGQARLVAKVGDVDYALVIHGERVVQFFPLP